MTSPPRADSGRPTRASPSVTTPTDRSATPERAAIHWQLGETVRSLRELRHMSLRELAERSGFSPSFVSQLENGHVAPSLHSLERIAQVLGVAVSQVVRMAEEHGKREPGAGEAPREGIYSEWAKMRVTAVGAGTAGSALESLLVQLEPEGTSGKKPHVAPQEEFVFVVRGEVVLTIGEDERTLTAGGAVTVPAGTARMWHNTSGAPAELLIVTPRT